MPKKPRRMGTGGPGKKVLDDLRDLLSDAETLVGACAEGYSEESVRALRDQLKASQGRILAEYQRVRESMVAGSARDSDSALSSACEVLALASGIGTLVGALADRQQA